MITKSLLRQHGRKVSLCDNNGVIKSFDALIQPLRYKNKMYLDGIYTEIGFNSQGHYLYIGPPDIDLTQASDSEFLKSDGISYQIDRAEKVYNAEKPFYIWAIIRTIVEESY